MYCSKCGAWNPEDSKFCAKCGERIEAVAAAPAAKPALRVTWLSVLLLAVALLCITAFTLRDRLFSAWIGLTASPTKVKPTVTTIATRIPETATSTVAAQPTLESSALPTPIETLSPTSQPSTTPSPTSKPVSRTFLLVYKECIPHGFGLGAVKGQVFDKSGRVIQGAKVRITINGYEWRSDANPATSNQDGWYEWVLEVGQKVQFVELSVGSKSVTFSPKGFEVEARGGCFQRVDFVEQ